MAKYNRSKIAQRRLIAKLKKEGRWTEPPYPYIAPGLWAEAIDGNYCDKLLDTPFHVPHGQTIGSMFEEDTWPRLSERDAANWTYEIIYDNTDDGRQEPIH